MESSEGDNQGSNAAPPNSKNGDTSTTRSMSTLAEKTPREVSKPITVFLHEEDKVRELFRGLKIADCSRFPAAAEEEDISEVVRDHLHISDVMSCSHCGVTFASRPEQVQHYKSDLHKYNVKRTACGLPPLSGRELSKLGVDDDVLSVSGSESDDEPDSEPASDRDPDSTSASDSGAGGVGRKRRTSYTDRDEKINQLKRHTKLFLTNTSRQMFCLYKCLVMSKWTPAGDTQVELAVKQLGRSPQVAVVLLAGGHFAAAVFSAGKPVLHKTFHSYTVRAKQGGSQSSRDARSGTSHPRSAGASLRRYNEAALTQHVQELLVSWESALARCSLIFVRALGASVGVLYGGKAPPLSRKDARIRPVPFPTRRPTHAEVLRVHTELVTIHVYGTDVDVDLTQVPKSPPKPDVPARSPRKRSDTTSPQSPNSPQACSPSVPSAGRRISVRDRRNQERQRSLEQVAEGSSSSASDGEEEDPLGGGSGGGGHGYTVRQMRSVADLSPLDLEGEQVADVDVLRPAVTATEERRRRREFRRRLRQEERDSARQERATENDDSKTEDRGGDEREPGGAEQQKVQVYTLCKTGDGAGLAAALDSACPLPADALLAAKFGPVQQSLLHTAARAGHSAAVRMLLDRGADPTARDSSNLAPYDVAADKNVRNEFRRFRADHPDRYNYAKAHIPQPLTSAMEEEKRQRDAEKKRLQNARRKEKLKEKRALQAAEQAERKEKQLIAEQERVQREREAEERRRFLALSDREKRALAAERRMRAQAVSAAPEAPPPVLVRCFSCATDITGQVPFTYADNLFCTVACVKRHRTGAAGAAKKA